MNLFTVKERIMEAQAVAENRQTQDYKVKVLVIDDDMMNCHAIQHHLGDSYSVSVAENGEKGLHVAVNELPDLILLDLHMPGTDGFEVCRSLRDGGVTHEIPIIVITGAAHQENRIKAYGLGADDLLSKPFSGAELMARVESKVRRIREKRQSISTVDCGNLSIDILQRKVSVLNNEVELSVIEYDLLKYLVENKDRVMNRNQILSRVWNGLSVSPRTIDTHVLALRKKLVGFDHEIISVYAIGYGLKSKNTT